MRHFKVVVMSGYLQVRTFWTMRGAIRFLEKWPKSGNLYVWNNSEWQLCRLFAKGGSI